MLFILDQARRHTRRRTPRNRYWSTGNVFRIGKLYWARIEPVQPLRLVRGTVKLLLSSFIQQNDTRQRHHLHAWNRKPDPGHAVVGPLTRNWMAESSHLLSRGKCQFLPLFLVIIGWRHVSSFWLLGKRKLSFLLFGAGDWECRAIGADQKKW